MRLSIGFNTFCSLLCNILHMLTFTHCILDHIGTFSSIQCARYLVPTLYLCNNNNNFICIIFMFCKTFKQLVKIIDNLLTS